MKSWGRRARAARARQDLIARLGVLRRAHLYGAFAAGFILASAIAVVAVLAVSG